MPTLLWCILLVDIWAPSAGRIVVFDSEWTSWEGANERGWSRDGEHREIVQIGAVKIDVRQNFKKIADFEVLVRPVVNPILSGYFSRLTGIDQSSIDASGVPLSDGLRAFADFIDDNVDAVYSNGADQIVFLENCQLIGVEYPFDEVDFRDAHSVIQSIVSGGNRVSSSDLPAALGFETPGPKHHALSDAIAVARAMQIAFEKIARQPA